MKRQAKMNTKNLKCCLILICIQIFSINPAFSDTKEISKGGTSIRRNSQDINSNYRTIKVSKKTLNWKRTKVSLLIENKPADLVIMADRVKRRLDYDSYRPSFYNMENGNFRFSPDEVRKRKIQFIGIANNNQKKQSKAVLFSFSFPYSNSGDYIERKLRNLIEGYDKRHFCFFNFTNSIDNLFFMKISLNLQENNIILSDTQMLQLPHTKSHYQDVYLTDFDPIRNRILDSSGSITKILKYYAIVTTYNAGKIKSCKDSLLGISGARFLSGNRLVFQCPSGEKQSNNPGNCLIIKYMDNNKSISAMAGVLHPYFTFRDWMMTPIEIIHKNKIILFTALYPDINKKYIKYLLAWNYKLNKIEKIVVLSKDQGSWPISKTLFVKFCPKKNSSLVAITNGEIEIVDIKKKKIIKMFDISRPKSIRWSNDGRYLGVLKYDGSFITYDLFKDELKVLDKDVDYFDFFWIK